MLEYEVDTGPGYQTHPKDKDLTLAWFTGFNDGLLSLEPVRQLLPGQRPMVIKDPRAMIARVSKRSGISRRIVRSAYENGFKEAINRRAKQDAEEKNSKE